jgi:NADH-quinone oxidoreductase subunit J
VSLAFFLCAAVLLGSAFAAITFRNLVHCALALAVSFGALAGLYLQLNAEFVAFAQVLIYLGAVAILILFAVLLTRGEGRGRLFSKGWIYGAVISTALFATLCTVVLKSPATANPDLSPRQLPAARIGQVLMKEYVLPLEVVGVLLTAALLGSVVLAMKEQRKR